MKKQKNEADAVQQVRNSYDTSTYLRITMGTDRLNGLALLNIHRDIHVVPEQIIDRLCAKPRRLPFRLV